VNNKELHDNLNRLRELTNIIQYPNNIISDYESKDLYELAQGDCIGRGIYREETITVQITHVKENTIIKNKEYPDKVKILIIYDGALNLDLYDKEIPLSLGDVVIIKPGEQYTIKNGNGCKLLTITILPLKKEYISTMII